MTDIHPRTRPCTRCGRSFDPALWRAYSKHGRMYWHSLCNKCADAKSNQWKLDNHIYWLELRRDNYAKKHPRPETYRPKNEKRRLQKLEAVLRKHGLKAKGT